MNTHVRIVFIFVSILFIAFITACGPSPADMDSTATQAAVDNFATQTAKAPTATATFTPTPTATLTPTPTMTPTPTQTPTPTPTKDPLAGEFVDGKFVINGESFGELMSIGDGMWEDEDYLYEVLLYSAMLDYSLEDDQLITLYNRRSEDYEYLGHYELAIEDYLRILDLGDRRSGFLNSLCWDYAITNQAEKALPYCEEAVKMDPSSETLDSPAVTYALLGKYPEAISDFEAALEQDDFPNDDMKAQRQDWLASLKAGNNPITEQVLKKERGDEISLEPNVYITGNITLYDLQPLYEDMGYVFEETVINGQPALTSTLKKGNCNVDLVLYGDHQEFKGGTSTIVGCSHEDLDGHSWDFIWVFTRDLDEMAKAIVWDIADVYYVIEGKPAAELNPVYSGFVFTVERTSVDGVVGLVVTAKPSE